MSLPLIARAIAETARISLPTFWDSTRGQLNAATCDTRLASWSARLLQQARIQLHVEGREHVTPEQSYVLLSNHQSLYDIPVLYQAVPLRIRMAAKAELFRVPFWGAAMAQAQFIPINRKRGPQARTALLEQGTQLAQSGVSIWIAPEGTRSKDGQLLPFKKGAFLLAQAAHLPLLPITLVGTRNVLGKKGLRIKKGQTVQVHIHPPLFPEQFPATLEELSTQMRRQIEAPLLTT